MTDRMRWESAHGVPASAGRTFATQSRREDPLLPVWMDVARPEGGTRCLASRALRKRHPRSCAGCHPSSPEKVTFKPPTSRSKGAVTFGDKTQFRPCG